MKSEKKTEKEKKKKKRIRPAPAGLLRRQGFYGLLKPLSVQAKATISLVT